MADRAAALQAVQIGVETTPGTPVAAGKVLSSLSSFTPAVTGDVTSDRVPTGTKFPVYTIPGREWVEADFDGILDYNEIVYFLAGNLRGDETPSGALLAKTWDFELSRAAQDNPKTFTIEQGNPDRAHQLSYAFVPELSLSFTPDEATFSGTIMGRGFADGVTMTASPTSVPPQPVHPSHVSIFMDNTFAAIGTTRLTRGFAADLSIGDKYQALFPVDRTQNRGFAGIVEGRPSIELGLTMESDAVGMDLLSRRRAGETKFVRIEAVGPTIQGVDTYRLRIDGAFKVTDMGGFGETDGVVTNEWTLVNVWDTGWAKALRAEVVNTTAAL